MINPLGASQPLKHIVGSFKTPHILELSGIGNPDVLSKFGIETIIDLPGVGENLRASLTTFLCQIPGSKPRTEDHVLLSTIAEVETSDKTTDDLLDPVFLRHHEEL